MNEKQALEILEKGKYVYQAFEHLAEALEVAAQAKERGDKLELRYRELDSKVDAKEKELSKLAETLVAAAAEAEKHLVKRAAEREALDREYGEYLKASIDKQEEAKKAYEQLLADYRKLEADTMAKQATIKDLEKYAKGLAAQAEINKNSADDAQRRYEQAKAAYEALVKKFS